MYKYNKSNFGKKQIKQAKKVDDVINYGLWHLGRKDHSTQELKTKMNRKTDNQDWIEEAINKLIGWKYLEEERFVDNFIHDSSKFKGHGPMRIKQNLKVKGVDPEAINNSLEDSEFDYFAAALDLLNKKQKTPIIEKKDKDRLTRYLIRRGFNFDMIKYAFSEHLKE